MPGLQGPPQTTANLSQGCPPAAQGGAFFDKGTQGYPATQPSPEAPELSGTELSSADPSSGAARLLRRGTGWGGNRHLP